MIVLLIYKRWILKDHRFYTLSQHKMADKKNNEPNKAVTNDSPNSVRGKEGVEVNIKNCARVVWILNCTLITNIHFSFLSQTSVPQLTHPTNHQRLLRHGGLYIPWPQKKPLQGQALLHNPLCIG